MNSQTVSASARFYHWVIALIMVGLLGVGITMAQFEIWPLYPIHKALGVLALFVIIPRVVMRLKQGMPLPVEQTPNWQHKVAKYAHWLLLASTLTMPLSGLLFSGFGGYGVDVFGVPLIPSQHTDNGVIAYHQGISDFGAQVHTINGYFLVALVVGHIAAALKHHFFDKDATLLRMLGRV
ncbi:cytochrome b [Pseudoalteromonas xiamenensis]|uniref:cytochrome b n=1 Tax=Pseudoalteromonas xiamenensis TaxID=882626 RepID=UPI0035F06D6C